MMMMTTKRLYCREFSDRRATKNDDGRSLAHPIRAGEEKVRMDDAMVQYRQVSEKFGVTFEIDSIFRSKIRCEKHAIFWHAFV